MGKLLSCKGCNVEFYVPNYRIGIAKFCSSKCRGDSARVRFRKPCEICGKIFDFIATRIDRAKYCSRKCYHKAMHQKGTVIYECRHCHKEFRGAPSHKRIYCSRDCNGKASIKIWKAKFTTVRRNMITRGMIKECQKCGYKEVPAILGVHHIDENRDNNHPGNLAVLCPNCHSLAHMKHISHVSSA
jgi:hypothetical protein